MSTETETLAPKMTLADAADAYVTAIEEMDRLKGILAQAEPVLLKYFERTGRPSYKRIGWRLTAVQTILDQDKVKEFLGARLPQFQKKTTPSRKLQLLGK